jgi:N utilization substance protein A
VGACVGVRGNRIKNIVDELAGERIDIVRWSDDPEVLIPNALQPAEVEQVLLCHMIGRAIVLVKEDQLSLAIGRRGQNVRLASKLCGWDIEIMTADELDEQIDRAVVGFSELEGMTEELAQSLVEQGYLSYDDLSVIEPDSLKQMGNLTEEQSERIIEQSERKAEEAERVAAEERRRQREQELLAQAEAAEAAADAKADALRYQTPDAGIVEGGPAGQPSVATEGEAAGQAVAAEPAAPEAASPDIAAGNRPETGSDAPAASDTTEADDKGSDKERIDM